MATEPAQAPSTGVESDAPASSGKLAFFMGWVVLPGSVIFGLIGLGAHWGARYPDAWFVDAVKWIAQQLL